MVIEHEAGDLTCTVEAATPLAELQHHLAASGQMLALDPPDDGSLTVGEVFDRALFGPRAHRYGRPRDLVLGVRARLAGGQVIHGGGKVVKNVAGYDLPKLFTGAHGRLGELLELTLRLHPLPAATCTLVTDPGDAAAFEPLAPACVDYAWPAGPAAGQVRERGRRGACGRRRRRRRRRAGRARRRAVGGPAGAAGRPRAAPLRLRPAPPPRPSGCAASAPPASPAAGRAAGCSPTCPRRGASRPRSSGA